MKAAVCYDEGAELVVEDISYMSPGAGEVVVRVGACAICQSDLHYLSGAWPGMNFPAICGHEVAGTVIAVGEGVRAIMEGARVIVSLIRDCGTCKYCQAGHPYLCRTAMPLDRESRFHNTSGERIYQGLRVGGFAEQVLVHQSQLVEIPVDMPFDQASLLACGVLTGYGAVVNAANIQPGASVAVIGIGGVGINCLQAAAITEAGPLIAIDVVPEKFHLARRLGASHTLNPNEVDPVEAVMEITAGFGADYVFVAAGSGVAMEQGAAMLSALGCMVIAALPPAGESAAVQPRLLVNKNQTIIGTKMGSARLSVDIPKLLAHYATGKLKLAELIAGRHELSEINHAIASAGRGEAARNVIVFDN